MDSQRDFAQEGVSAVTGELADKPRTVARYIAFNRKHGRTVVGAQINQLAYFAGMQPELNGAPCRVPDMLFCNAGKISNIDTMLSRVESLVNLGRFSS